MSLRNTARALPTLLRVGFADAVAYRAEMIVWVLATTMPLVMLGLWTAVARDAPVGRYGEPQFQAYFLATFIVRQLTGCWAFWEMNFELKSGTLSMRLLRPVHPLWAYAAEGVAAVPLRVALALPVAVVALALVGPAGVSRSPLVWLVWLASIAGAWILTLLVNLLVGCAAFFFESSLKLMDLWLVFYFVLSGYLIPIDIFPPRLRALVDWLPFRYQIGFPVELMIDSYSVRQALVLLARQMAWVAIFFVATRWSWRRGVARFAAYGG